MDTLAWKAEIVGRSAQLLYATATRVRLERAERLDDLAQISRPLLFSANHHSNLDPMAIGFTMQAYGRKHFGEPSRKTGVSETYHFIPWIVAKPELTRIPFLNWGKMVPIHRNGSTLSDILDNVKPDAELFVDMMTSQKTNNNFLIFAQGHRMPPGELGRAKWLAGYMAHHADPVIVPLYITGTEGGVQSALKRIPTPWNHLDISVTVGEPYELSDSRGEPPSNVFSHDKREHTQAARFYQGIAADMMKAVERTRDER